MCVWECEVSVCVCVCGSVTQVGGKCVREKGCVSSVFSSVRDSLELLVLMVELELL